MRLFLDANVLFTAAITPAGASGALFELARVGACVLLTSAFALDEARRNIRVKRPASMGALASLEDQLGLVKEADAALVTWAGGLLPHKDAPILAAAVVGKTDLLVTGDRRHFEALYDKTVKGVTVVSPRGALEYLLGS